MRTTPGVPKNPPSPGRFIWIGLAAILFVCAILAFIMFANRDNPSAVPTIQVEALATAATHLASPPVPDSAQFVELRLNPRILGNLLFIEGQTNLPNRALLVYEASEVSANPKVETGSMPVLDGKYLREVDLSGWQAGTIAVWVGFQTVLDGSERQPEEVIERFGELGEFLYGENVKESGGLRRVEAMQTIEFVP